MRLGRRWAPAALLLAIGCGSSGGSVAGPAGVDASEQVSAASDADKGALCDWYAGLVGGYGAAHTCAMAQITAPPDKATCISQFPVCNVTVGVLEDCFGRFASAQDTCTQAALSAAQTAPSCMTVAMAGCFQ